MYTKERLPRAPPYAPWDLNMTRVCVQGYLWLAINSVAVLCLFQSRFRYFPPSPFPFHHPT